MKLDDLKPTTLLEAESDAFFSEPAVFNYQHMQEFFNLCTVSRLAKAVRVDPETWLAADHETYDKYQNIVTNQITISRKFGWHPTQPSFAHQLLGVDFECRLTYESDESDYHEDCDTFYSVIDFKLPLLNGKIDSQLMTIVWDEFVTIAYAGHPDYNHLIISIPTGIAFNPRYIDCLKRDLT